MAERTVGGYTLVQALGKGSAATVYLVRDVETQKEYAMKLLHPQEAAKPGMQKRFVREAVLLKQLHHPNIVEFVDCGINDDELYVVMELVQCGSLRSALRNYGKIPWRTAVKVAGQVCEGLAHAHRQGVIHRDLKPANLFISTEGRVKIGDFGLARDLNRHRLTMANAAIGTCRYMAPEQIRCEDPLTGAVDLYALGTVIFQMIVGRPMFDGSTHMEVFNQHLVGAPPLLSDEAPECPQGLSDLVAQLVAKAPEDRPEDAESVALTLAKLLAQTTTGEDRAGAARGGTDLEESPDDDDLSIELMTDETKAD